MSVRNSARKTDRQTDTKQTSPRACRCLFNSEYFNKADRQREIRLGVREGKDKAEGDSQRVEKRRWGIESE